MKRRLLLLTLLLLIAGCCFAQTINMEYADQAHGNGGIAATPVSEGLPVIGSGYRSTSRYGAPIVLPGEKNSFAGQSEPQRAKPGGGGATGTVPTPVGDIPVCLIAALAATYLLYHRRKKLS